jgi:adenosylcobinamide-GDP ribazoletransferase
VQNLVVWAKRWLLAIQFLTIFPIPEVRSVNEEDFRQSVAFYPMVGMALGTGLGLLQWGFTQIMPVMPATVLSLAGYSLATGFLHLDGVMDLADGIGSRKPRPEALNIMRDSRVGSMGVVAGILVMAGKFAALSSLSPGRLGPFVVIPALSRWAMVLAMTSAPYARLGEPGIGSIYALHVSRIALWASSLTAVLVAVLLLPVVEAVGVLGLTLVVAWTMVWFARRRLGGMTGDVYGAINELVEWLGWTLVLVWHG